MALKNKDRRSASKRSPLSPKSKSTAAANAKSDDDVADAMVADVVIVCALQVPELAKLLQTGDAAWKRVSPRREDPHTYQTTTYKTKKGNSIRVVAGAPNQMGLSAVAVLATKMILHFRPKLVVMVGIAAGASKRKQGYGNILAASTTFDYGAGKIVEEKGKVGFQPDHEPIPIDTRLKSLLLDWKAKRRELDGIYKEWQGTRPTTVLDLHVGPLGSGAAVVDSRQSVLKVLTHWRKLIGIEMEAYGVHRACLDTLSPPPMFACFKSICDFAQGKTDEWQEYAAYTAAEFCYRFLIGEWENLYLEQIRENVPTPSAEPHPHDIKLLKTVRAALSPGLQRFLVQHSFGTSFRHKVLSPLHEMAEAWVGTKYRFHDAQLQAAFEMLMAAIHRFTGVVNVRTFVDDRNVELCTPLTDMDRQHGISENTLKGIADMNDAANAVAKEIEKFEDIARARLRV